MTREDLRMILEYIALDEKLDRRTRADKFAAAIVMWLETSETSTAMEAFETFDDIMASIVEQHNLQLH